MKTTLSLVAAAAVLASACFLRTWRLDAAPFHADEAVQAVIFQDLLEHGKYRYDPRHYHGPLPHWVNAAWMKPAGLRTLADLQEWHFRLLPAAAGLGLVFAVMAALWKISRPAALTAGMFAATSPVLVFFSRFGLHESLFALMGFLASMAAFLLLRHPSLARGVLLGALTALAAACKETWVFLIPAWGLAALASGVAHPIAMKKLVVPSLAAAGVFFVSLVLLFGGPAGFADFWRSYWVYETQAGHHKAFWYYFSVLVPKGTWWCGEPWIWLALFALAIPAVAPSKNPDAGTSAPQLPLRTIPKPLRFLAITGLMVLLILSFIPYKTPWLLMLPLALCLPAAGFAAARTAVCGKWGVLVFVLFAAAISWQAQCAWSVSQKRHWDARIPLVYSPSSHDMPRFRAYLQKAAAGKSIAVIGSGYWPLPWYLRGFPNVGYFAEPPAGFDVFLFCGPMSESAVPSITGEERLWGVRTDYLMRSVLKPEHPQDNSSP